MKWLRLIYGYLKHIPVVTLLAGAFFGWYFQVYVFGNWLPQWGLGGPVWSLVLFAVIVALLALGLAAYERYRARRRKLVVVGKPPQPRRGLIMLISKEVTAQAALAHHHEKLEYVWFIVTMRTEGLPGKLWRPLIGVVHSNQLVIDHWRPAETANAVQRALLHAQGLGMAVDEVICDITGGTTAMTYGAILACQQAGLDMEMVPAEYDVKLKALTPMGVILLEDEDGDGDKPENVSA